MSNESPVAPPRSEDAGIAEALDLIAKRAHASQVASADLLGTIQDTNYVSWFAHMHYRLAMAMDVYQKISNPAEVAYVDIDTGLVTTPDEGVLIGLPAELGQIALMILGFMKHVGCDPGEVLTLLLEQGDRIHEEGGDSDLTPEENNETSAEATE